MVSRISVAASMILIFLYAFMPITRMTAARSASRKLCGADLTSEKSTKKR
uniref:Uncharacterized protein n=1 Tax=Candidatus Kentrum sp. LFY TaxID=2126342 RepID=A0A450UPV4_9GAMM|nr:MAG: hypothetical protein BECKLFY1418B_GA0070995_10607 [Candidatus Kentron sp. LFY]